MVSGAHMLETSAACLMLITDVQVDYASTKGALVAFTRALSKNLVSKGIVSSLHYL